MSSDNDTIILTPKYVRIQNKHIIIEYYLKPETKFRVFSSANIPW